MRYWKDSSTEPINRDGHENITRDEITKDPEEDHDLAGDPVSPPRDCGSPGYLQWNTNQNNLQINQIILERWNPHPNKL